jgi:hypothetical protein
VLDELEIHLVPILLEGERAATHLHYRAGGR